MRALIFEDEPAALMHLKKMLHSIHPEIEFVGEADSISEAIEKINSLQNIDVIFTDVQLADGNCFEIFKRITPRCPIIFTTAYNEFAIQAFKVNAIDYLLKPIKKAELTITVEKLIAKKQEAQTAAIDYNQLAKAILAKEQQFDKRYMIRFGEQVRTVESSEIAYAYSMQKAVYITTFSGKTYPVDRSLDQLESDLNPKDFFRINRGFIVNIRSIGNMSVVSKSRVKLELNPVFHESEVISSTERSPAFKEWLKR